MKTKVKFLIENDGVFAFFPEIKETADGWACYSHVGQHSICGYLYADSCEEATEEQYKDLKSELEQIGYKLKVLNKPKTGQNLSILMPLICLLIASFSYGQTDQQDTVKVYINKKRTDNDGKTHLWYSKIENGKIMDGRKDTLFYSVCDCPKSRKLPEQGDTSKILRRDMIYMDNKVTWRKVNN